MTRMIPLTYCHTSGIFSSLVVSDMYSSNLSKTSVQVSMAEESKEQFLADLSVRLSKLAAELGVGIVTIGHTNDDGAVKYCRMIEQRASVVVDLNVTRCQRMQMNETQPSYWSQRTVQLAPQGMQDS
jgi:hypothetical protein